MIKFKDDMHKDTEDGFKIETNYKGQHFIRIYQEMDSGVVRTIYLSHDDLKQINTNLIDHIREETKNA
jgi:hypothetical protein